MPHYPPIARAARQEGRVAATFDVDSTGKAQNIVIESGNKMLESAVKAAVAEWEFPAAAYDKSEQITLEFKLNCTLMIRTHVN